MIFGTAGHTDHGKTALVRALTGVDTDRLPDERRRGISIELGFAPLTLDDGTRVSIVDVPGHERFVETMTAGAYGLDAAVLVVAATEGVMPQTREHCAILRALHVPVVAVALTKVDCVAEEARVMMTARVGESLEPCGVASTAPIVPVRAPAGVGVDRVRAVITGAALRLPPRDPDDLFRFVVDRAFTLRGAGTVVTGTVWSGAATVGARVRVLPGAADWRIRAMQSHGVAVERAAAGARIALVLADATPADITRGATLVTDACWSATTRLIVRLAAAGPRLPRVISVQLGGRRATAHWSATSVDACVLRLALDRPLVARGGDRLVIRAGATLGGVIGAAVLDPFPERGAAVARDSALAQLAALAGAAGARGLPRATLPVRIGVSPRQLDALATAVPLRPVGDLLVHADVLTRLARAVVETVERDAAAHPFADGLGLDAVRTSFRAPAAIIGAAMALAVEHGHVVSRDGRLCPLSEGRSADADVVLERVLRRVAAAGLAGVSAEEAAGVFGADAAGVLRYAERRGNLIRLHGVRYCEASVLTGAIERLRLAMRSGREFTPSELRGVLGVSRKYLIPLLEYCDAAGVTVRRSGGRVLADVSSR